jgi:hypothetical protein
MQSAGMMQNTTSHMQMTQNVSADSLMTLMPAHRQMGEDMLERGRRHRPPAITGMAARGEFVMVTPDCSG